jgi:Glycosyltransferase family 87
MAGSPAIGVVDGARDAARPGAARQARPATIRHAALLLGPIFVFLAVFVWLVALTIPRFSGPSGGGYGGDFAVFYEASKVMEAGHNPYNDNLLWNTERRDFAAAGLRIPPDRTLVRVGNPPILFWALRPIASLPFRAAGILWTSAMYLLSLLGFLILLRWLGWRRRALPAAVFLAMPQVVLGAFYGDLIGLVFAAVAGSIVAARRYPTLSGALLGICWLKPHIALPAVLLIWAFHTEARRKLALGFLAASVFLGGLTLAAVGFAGVHEWIGGLLGWTQSIRGQPEIASMAGLYYLWASPALRTVLSGLCLAVALGATFLTWRQFYPRVPDPLSIGWLWGLWILCVPYAHINDAMLLTLPVLLLLGRDGRELLRPRSLLILYLLCSCFLLGRIPGVPFDLEPLKLLAVVVILAWAARREGVVTPRPVVDRQGRGRESLVFGL